jgi:formylglycine-generating enzyme required for sulfatase activity
VLGVDAHDVGAEHGFMRAEDDVLGRRAARRIVFALAAAGLATADITLGSSPARATTLASATVPGACPEGMAALRAGTFTMGDRKDRVSVQPFCLDVSEVTSTAYAECVGSEQCSADHLGEYSIDGSAFTGTHRCNYGVWERNFHPINCVDWNQAASYCLAVGKRLPTEEEWEWAARGEGKASIYPWGNSTPDAQLCWSGVYMRTDTCPVGGFPQGDAPRGIHDLAGNVWEWTSSRHALRERVVRGGGGPFDVASDVRAAARRGYPASFRNTHVGFRCAR